MSLLSYKCGVLIDGFNCVVRTVTQIPKLKSLNFRVKGEELRLWVKYEHEHVRILRPNTSQ